MSLKLVLTNISVGPLNIELIQPEKALEMSLYGAFENWSALAIKILSSGKATA